jgi:hypothetical protein
VQVARAGAGERLRLGGRFRGGSAPAPASFIGSVPFIRTMEAGGDACGRLCRQAVPHRGAGWPRFRAKMGMLSGMTTPPVAGAGAATPTRILTAVVVRVVPRCWHVSATVARAVGGSQAPPQAERHSNAVRGLGRRRIGHGHGYADRAADRAAPRTGGQGDGAVADTPARAVRAELADDLGSGRDEAAQGRTGAGPGTGQLPGARGVRPRLAVGPAALAGEIDVQRGSRGAGRAEPSGNSR